MNPRSTKILLIIAAALFLFIMLFERKMPDTLTALRESSRILPGFKSENIVRFEVVGMDSIPELTVQREKPGSEWFILRPEKYPASEYAIESFIQGLSELPKLSYVAEDSSSKDFGFEKGSIVISIRDSSGQEWRLKLGAPTEAGRGLYLQVGDLSKVYVTDVSLLSRLPEVVSEWKRRLVFQQEALDFDVIEVSHGDLTYELSRQQQQDGTWRLTQPIEARASQPLVMALEQTLKSLRVEEFVEGSSEISGDRYGLQSPAGFLKLKRGSMELATLVFGSLAEEGYEAALDIGLDPESPDAALVQSRYARLSNQKDVVLIAETLAELTLAPYLRFRDPSVISIEPGSVDRLEVRGSEFFVIQQQANSTNWVYQADPEYPLDPALVGETIGTLSSMRIQQFHDLPNDLKPFGLAPPMRQFVLKESGENEDSVVAQLDLGFNQAMEAFVKRSDETSVYQVAPSAVFKLPKGIFQLRSRRLWDFDSGDVHTATVSMRDQSRTLKRNSQDQWSIAPGSSGIINPFAVEEAVYLLSQADAVAWTDQGIDKLKSYQLQEGAFTIAWNVGLGDDAQEYKLRFGGISPTSQNPYAATLINGKWTVFEFPGEIYGSLLYAFNIPVQSP